MGVEPIAYRLQGGCSAIELRRQAIKKRLTFPALRHYTRAINGRQHGSLTGFQYTVNNMIITTSAFEVIIVFSRLYADLESSPSDWKALH
jgi:hypothetical protein